MTLARCKGVTVKDFTVDGLALASFNARIENANIHNFKNKNGKVKISNCTIRNKDD